MNRFTHFSETARWRPSTRAQAASSLLVLLLASLWTVAPGADGERDTPQDGRGAAPRPIRALYVTGGGFHEFVKQEGILPPAVTQRANVQWTIDHTAGTSTEVLIERHKNTDWAKEFDVVLYNMSFSFVTDVPWIERIARAHHKAASGPSSCTAPSTATGVPSRGRGAS